MYRIIAGKWKAKKIAAPKNFDVRPTTDFAKEALFSILENTYDMQSISVLDLFAGIGSITFEFASRGCQDITSVEMNPKHTSFLNSTASELGFSLLVSVQRGDTFDWLKKFRNKKSYEIVFSDAPFEMEEKKYHELISLVLNNKYLKENGVLVVEHQSRMKFDHPNLIDTRKYGNVSFSFFEPNKGEITEIQNQEV
ncbi:16S rRNA (guanine966-N2)-methyltransferase [Chryseobacterium ginsenosidimutans]|uniref:RsmD family RNA methyltransferase n=1 Tax=Chryseobacterium ginsenosidimutans TaxID=687846 RepID=UPI002786E7DE|nr:RsmD family RNA methyltransferase [Chryseobacterium ginsenosidimutans]MDQ0595612.1 16S rRNA (guanine966-N2)-methyltransferase [Chryseobacterium ginsenosidimutans]